MPGLKGDGKWQKGEREDIPPPSLGATPKKLPYLLLRDSISSLRNYLQVVVDQARYTTTTTYVPFSFVPDFWCRALFSFFLSYSPVLDGDCNHNEIRRWAPSYIPPSLLIQSLSTNICAVDCPRWSRRGETGPAGTKSESSKSIFESSFFFIYFFF